MTKQQRIKAVRSAMTVARPGSKVEADLKTLLARLTA